MPNLNKTENKSEVGSQKIESQRPRPEVRTQKTKTKAKRLMLLYRIPKPEAYLKYSLTFAVLT